MVSIKRFRQVAVCYSADEAWAALMAYFDWAACPSCGDATPSAGQVCHGCHIEHTQGADDE